MFEPESKGANRLLEELSSVFHNAWVEWSNNLAAEESLSPERLERWKKLWVPYEELDDKEKEQDRKWARKVLGVTLVVAQKQFDKWANNLEKRLKKRGQEIKRK